jgi:hypothetical protein
MRRKLNTLLGLSLSAAFLTALPAAADLPFGVLEGLSGGHNAGGGILPITGWTLDDDGIARVEIFVDGVVYSVADYGQNRPGIELEFPGYPDGVQSGFGILLDSTRYNNDLHTFTARVTSNTGEQVFLNPVVIQVNNVTSTLRPFGAITSPNPSVELFGTCDPDAVFRRLSPVHGWALDLGVEEGDTGVKFVELLVNGALLANTLTDCVFDINQGGLTNCYGLQSLDVERMLPTVANSPHARWRFVLDVGALIADGFSQGAHTLTIRSGDYEGNFANIAEMPVVFFCDENTGNQGSFGYIDHPYGGEFTYGVTPVVGWALDAEGIFEIQVYLDGVHVGNATYGFARPDVTTHFPGYPDSLAPGWLFNLDTTLTSDGHHHLQVIAVDDFGVETIIGEHYFQIDNESP